MKNASTLGFVVVLMAAGNIRPVEAVVVGHRTSANAVNSCQAFKPGPSSDIRNRAIGIANVGQPTNIACSFSWVYNGDDGATVPTGLLVYFSNDNAAGSIRVTCSLLAGRVAGPTYVVTKTTAAISPGSIASLVWAPADNPVPGATDLGDGLININCALPTGAEINETYLTWNQDNGVGT